MLGNDPTIMLRAAYVLGQLSHEASVPALTKVLENTSEHPMVRHEAAEALGSIATGDCLPVLEKFLRDKDVCGCTSGNIGAGVTGYLMSM